ncbi:uncharacterized protein EV154DRAFT_388869, partial [Mucor mucedo]|uniref:uncharacterized protein n=1 Tax=Mucor mucedo TaxID=29922 RepID=UPI00221FC5DE
VENTGDINSMCILSLFHLFPVNKCDVNLCITSYVKRIKDVLYAFAANASKDVLMVKISDECLLYLKRVCPIYTIDNDGDASSIPYDPELELDTNLKSACSEFVSLLATRSSERSEDMFFQRYLKPMITIGITKPGGTDFVSSGPGKVSKYQVEDDFVKLNTHLKHSIDKQASLGVENPVALGLLCEGFVCSLIKMALVEKGVYLPITIRKFRVPELQSDLLFLPKTMECLHFVLKEIRGFPEKYGNRKKKALVK